MTGRTSRIQKYMLCFQKTHLGENYDFTEKKNCKKVDFFFLRF